MDKIIKIVILFVVGVVLFNSIIFIGLGVYKSIHGYALLIHGDMAARPGVHIAEALDSFLIAIFFIIFSIGIAKLFLPGSSLFKNYELPWLKLDSFSSLKLVLWEMLLTSLFVYFVAAIIINVDQIDWKTLITPASILMLSIAYKFLRGGH